MGSTYFCLVCRGCSVVFTFFVSTSFQKKSYFFYTNLGFRTNFFFGLRGCTILFFFNQTKMFGWKLFWAGKVARQTDIATYTNDEYVWMSLKVTSKFHTPGITPTWNACNWSSRWGQVIWMTFLDWLGLLWPGTASWPLHKNYRSNQEVLRKNIYNWFKIYPILTGMCHMSLFSATISVDAGEVLWFREIFVTASVLLLTLSVNNIYSQRGASDIYIFS